ncbi:MAG: hypothetical protein ACTSWI_00790 [Alphaproteobacteria bacterium]
MAGPPWFKFYPRDWRGDQALRAVSVAARGLWIECLCVMHEAKPYGHLMLNGTAVEGDTLARMTGVPVDEVSTLIDELQQAGVLSRTRKGVIFSRRMTKDHARSLKGTSAANRRWSQAPDKGGTSGRPIGSPKTSPNAQSLEARLQTEDADASLSERGSDMQPSRSKRSYPSEFECLWKAYPTDPLMSKKAAYQAWQRIAQEARDLVLESVPAFRAYCRAHPDYRPVHLVRYLQQERHVGFLLPAKISSSQVFVSKDSEAFAAWQSVKPTPTVRSESGEEGWWFPAEWPDDKGISSNPLAGFLPTSATSTKN